MQHDTAIELPETLEAITSRISIPTAADKGRKTADITVYKYYFSAMGWLRVFVLSFILAVSGGIGGLRGMSKLPQPIINVV